MASSKKRSGHPSSGGGGGSNTCSNRWSLDSFLREVSLPGVKYLAANDEGRRGGRQEGGALARLLWTACIAASAGGAASIIYLNVSEWRDSPVLVSGVESARLKESIIFFDSQCVQLV